YEAPQGPVEEALAAIWSELLGLEQVGRHDNFFELGGHSLLAISMVSRIRTFHHVDLDLTSIFDTRTLANLAKHVAQVRQATRQITYLAQQSPIVRVKDGTSPTTYLFHAMGGGVGGYEKLIASLPQNQTLKAIHAYSPELTRASTIERIAETYAAHMDLAQPDMPFSLVGFSFGGTLATEVARALAARGKQIKALTLIEPPVPTFAPALPFSPHFNQRMTDFARFVSDGRILDFSIDGERPRKSHFHALRRELAELRGEWKTPTNDILQQMFQVFVRHKRAFDTYLGRPYLAPVTAFFAKERKGATLERAIETHWPKAETHWLHANHSTIMDQPFVGFIAQVMIEQASK
ncbi:thioesterase domain-containing protein, partial [Phenylobacterium sp.]|uniref:thioesterase domain-containing protein n=1 Tax=Phenylobacterium sp. TaxID=1871053 RepID=UPI002FC9800C